MLQQTQKSLGGGGGRIVERGRGRGGDRRLVSILFCSIFPSTRERTMQLVG